MCCLTATLHAESLFLLLTFQEAGRQSPYWHAALVMVLHAPAVIPVSLCGALARHRLLCRHAMVPPRWCTDDRCKQMLGCRMSVDASPTLEATMYAGSGAPLWAAMLGEENSHLVELKRCLRHDLVLISHD